MISNTLLGLDFHLGETADMLRNTAQSFAADEVARQAIVGVASLVIGHHLINVDMADVRSVMKDAGNLVVSSK